MVNCSFTVRRSLDPMPATQRERRKTLLSWVAIEASKLTFACVYFYQGTPGLPGSPGTPGERGKKVSPQILFSVLFE